MCEGLLVWVPASVDGCMGVGVGVDVRVCCGSACACHVCEGVRVRVRACAYLKGLSVSHQPNCQWGS